MSLRNFSVPKLSFSKRYFLLPIILIVFFLLFYLVYNDIKAKTIDEFNNEQLIIAQAASQGIASFFQNYQNELTFLSQNKWIIDFNDDTKALMESFYNYHKNLIEAVTRVDVNGKILYTYPFKKSVIGENISYQKHVHQVLTTHQPVISDVFMSVQGYLAVALHVPVFNGKEFKGSIAILIQIDKLGKMYFEKIKIRETYNTWLLSENGIEIFCQIKGHKGKSLLEITHNDPSVTQLLNKLKKENKGTTKNIHQREGDEGQTKFIEKHIAFYRVPLGNTYWTIMISYNEEEIYAALTGFRNRLIVIFSFLFIVMAYYFYSFTKVRTVLKEEKKRKEAEKTLHESEEIFRRFMDHSPIYVFFKDENIRSLRLSKNYETMLGKPLDELLGKNMDELFPSDLAKSMVADDKRILKEGKEIIVEEKLNGRFYSTIKFPIFIEGKPRFLAGYTIDITEKKQAEETLQMWGNVFTNAGWGVSVSNKDGQYLEMMNPRFAEMHGFSIDELKGQPILSLYPPNVHEDFLNQIKIAHQRGHHLFESYHLRKDGTSFPVIIDVTIVKDPEGDAFYRIVNVQDITERKRAEDALRESEFQLSQLWAATVEGIVIHDQGIIIEVNDAMCRLFGVSREKVIGKSILDFATAETRDRLKKDFASESYGISEVTAIRSDGTTLTLEVLTRQIFYQGKNLRIAASRDITDHKQAEEAMRRSEEDYRKLFENHSAVKLIVDPETGTIFDVNHAAAEYYGWTREEMKKMKINEINIFSSEEIQNAMKKARDSKHVHFEFKHKRADGSIRDVDVYTHITTMAGKEYLHSIIMDITDRKQAEFVLQEEQSLSNSILNSLPGIVYIFDENGKFLRWNKNFEKASGYSYEEITERHPSDFFAGDEKELVLKRIQDVFIKGEANVEAYFISKKGKGTPHFFTGAKIEIKGKPMLIGMGMDITERKQAEEALRKSEQLFRVAFDNAPTGMSIIGSDGFNYLAVNPLLCKMFGYTKEEFMGNTIQLVTHPDDEERSNEWIRKKYNDEPCESDFEKRFIHKNGHIVWGLVRAQWIKNDNGSNLMAIAHILDITKRKLAEEAVKKSEEKYRSIFENVQDVYYETLVDGKILEVSPAIEIISKGQYHREDLIGKSMYEFYPDANERDSLIATMRRTGSVSGFEVRLRNRDGSIIHCSISAKLSINSNGQIEKIIGSMHDISERKRAEEALQEKETRYRTLFDLSPSGILLMDTDGIIIDTNESFCKSVLYDRDELIGKNILLVVPEQRHSDVKDHIQKIQSGIILEHVVKNVKKDGTLCDMELRESLVLLPDGRKGILTTANNITERKLIEETLKESENKFRTVIEEAVEIVFTVDNRGYFTYVNPAGIKSTGYSFDELNKIKYIDLVETKYKQKAKFNYFRQFKERRAVATEDYPICTKSGEIKWFNQNVRLIIENDEVKGFYVISRDITERRKAEEALQEKENQMRMIVEGTPQLFFYTQDAQSKVTYISPSITKITGHSVEEWLKQSHWFVTDNKINEEAKERTHAHLRGELTEGPTLVEVEGADKHPILLEVYESPIVKNENIIGLYGVAHDITDRKRSEKALSESEEKFRSLVESINEVFYIADKNGKIVYCSPNITAATGFAVQEIIGNSFLKLIAPIDRRLVLNNYTELTTKGESDTMQVFRVRCKDGTIVWAEQITHLVRDTAGSVVEYRNVTRDITERKNAEELLRKSQEDLMKFFEDDLSADYISTPSGQLLNCNKTYLNVFGFKSKEEALAFPLNKIYPASTSRKVFIDLLKKNNKVENLEGEYVAIDGRPIYTIENAVGEFDNAGELSQIRGYIVDITERKKAEEGLKKLSRAVEQSPASVVITNRDGDIEYVNEKFCRVTGYSKEEAIGNNPRILNSGHHDKNFFSDIWNTILEGENWEGEMRNKKKNGELYWESVLISPLVNSEGKITHFVAVKEDITEKKMIFEELIEAKEKAEQSNKLKDAFIANMSHEIRTPLNGILGLSSIIKGLYAEHVKEDEESIFSGIEHSSKRIIRTVDMILNYSRVQTGEFPINPIQIELSLICENLVKEFTITAKNRLLDLSFENRIGKAISMFGDEYSVTHAISNLIDNAIKYTDKGFIKVILYSGKDDEILLDITDSGIGISKEYLTHIFQPYQQEHIGYGRAYEGIGLGLSMVKKILNLNKADIFVESEKGKGTTFTINFGNILQPLAIKMVDKKPDKIITEQVTHKKPLVLLIEDDAFNQTAIKIFIGKSYDTIVTDSSEGAIELLNNNKVDILLMDISIKGSKNGLELTKEIKASKKYSHIPVIAITAHAFEKDKQNAFEAGCDDYLSKPFSKDLLLEIIGKYF